jgi:hypothetical protein
MSSTERSAVIFGRKKAPALVEPAEPAPQAPEPTEADQAQDLDDWQQYDVSQDWRADGPFDIDEVDLSVDEVERIDLGAVIITPEKGMSIKLVANAQTNQVLHLVVENGPQSSIQVTVLAAPAAQDYRAQLRRDIIAGTDNAKVVEQVKGPFGTELRRVVAVTDPQGREGLAPMRDWLIAGPRWVLNVRLFGQAAVDTTNQGSAGALKEFVHNLVVRRGETAMAPGAVVALTAPTAA